MCIILADERHGACVGYTMRKRLCMRKQVFENTALNRSKAPKTCSSARGDKDWNE